MNRFDQQVAFVTGAGHGIGRACALRLASEGAAVAVVDIDAEAAQRVVQEINESDGDAIAVRCDVTDAASVDAAVAATIKRLGRVTTLVNTAGGDVEEPPFTEMTDELWSRAVDLNLTGVMRVIRATLPHLLKVSAASIVTIGSVNGMTALGSYPYSSAKAGLEMLTRNLAAEYAPRGVRANLVVPATIRTRVWDSQPESLERLTRLYPLGRVGEPEDVAAAVAFLASRDASWITGVSLPVDGGFLTGPMSYLRANTDGDTD